MFTGIVEEVGNVDTIEKVNGLLTMVVNARIVTSDLKPSDSVAVNGACLTVTERSPTSFTVEIVPETMRRTNLGNLERGQQVNLERPIAAHGRLGGHFVQGHVDATGRVTDVRKDGDALDIEIAAPPSVQRYLVEKGFVAVDGASLTITKVHPEGFRISLVPYSQSHLSPNIRTPGARVNLEVDILAKYLEKLLVDSGGILYAT